MILKDPMQENRKRDHIEMATSAQSSKADIDARFFYEPLLSAHPKQNDQSLATTFLGKQLGAPLWISSMTGGVGEARIINQNLARVAREFKLGMGLGSCRVLLESDQYFEDFNLRPILGDELPFFANLGIAQLENLVLEQKVSRLATLVERLQADGIIIHINPLQEWFQKEGDRLTLSPLETLTRFLSQYHGKVLVKEVGQGMGPMSLKALLDLPIAGIELAGFGGTNFSKLEILRTKAGHTNEYALARVGHTALEMIEMINSFSAANSQYAKKEIIISGGVNDILDGHYYQQTLKNNSVIGFAKRFLDHSENYEQLQKWTEDQIQSLKMARAFLKARSIAEAPCKL
jgi:isopentenyl-diphosphate delta-isomerase